MTRRVMVAANWKMHTDAGSARDLASSVLAGLSDELSCEVVLFPPALFVEAVVTLVSGSQSRICSVGGQDLHHEDKGAFTGALAGPQIASTGARWVLVGHSERRHVFGDDDATVGRKLQAAVRAGLTPVLCVGEQLAERDAGESVAVVTRQLEAALDGFPVDQELVVAYEPVWAIGTGRTASPELAQEMHSALRAALGGRDVRILYGGSVKPANAAELMGQPDIDGVLVGGASLQADSFLQIIRAA